MIKLKIHVMKGNSYTADTVTTHI